MQYDLQAPANLLGTKHFSGNDKKRGKIIFFSHTLVQSEEMWLLPRLCNKCISLISNISLSAPNCILSFKTLNILKRFSGLM